MSEKAKETATKTSAKSERTPTADDLKFDDKVLPVSEEEKERGYAIRPFVLRGKIVPNYIEVVDGKLGRVATLELSRMKKHLANPKNPQNWR